MDRVAAVIAHLESMNNLGHVKYSVVRTRTGTEMHMGYENGGPTFCGVRNSSPVKAERLTKFASFCEKCFSSHIFTEVK